MYKEPVHVFALKLEDGTVYPTALLDGDEWYEIIIDIESPQGWHIVPITGIVVQAVLVVNTRRPTGLIKGS